jgi:myo-inositol-1(or 4)-monophosphatase
MSPRESALLAARVAGEIQRRRLGGDLGIERKGVGDITTEVDHACEAAIIDVLRARHPDHDIVAEEGRGSRLGSRSCWLVDPLDGTKNFAHGYRRFCVSIALALDGQVELGVVLNPILWELFVAEAGRGATLEGVPIAVSARGELGDALVASTVDAAPAQLARLGRVAAVARAVRCDGSAALDLCDVACGRLDAYFEAGLAPWDTAAGALIVAEAGGRISTFSGGHHGIGAHETLATNGRLHPPLARLMQNADPTGDP